MKCFTHLGRGVLLYISLGIGNVFAQQDPLTSQFMYNQLAYNPSYAGINNITNITLNTRFQWQGFEGAPKTYMLTGTTSVIGGKVGLGAALIYDELGINKNTQGQLSYSYKIQQADKTFSFGLQTGFMTVKVDDAALNLKVADDPFFQGTVESATKVNFGAGASFMSDHYFIGFSVPRLINSKFETNNVSLEYERHFYITGGYIFQVSPTIKLKPMVLIKGVKGAPLSADINVSALLLNQLWVGAFTRNFNTYGAMAQFELKNAYRIGYSFELLSEKTAGSWLPTNEIFLSADLAIFSHQSIFQRFF
ncbi:MAG: type IX secretion system membrane protein PorP/SprF [Cyclobacteriaceae bacterium]|nr:type IX secretion system membrane protein PorP/SprF [Cyclobacteriaceae bacterium]